MKTTFKLGNIVLKEESLGEVRLEGLEVTAEYGVEEMVTGAKIAKEFIDFFPEMVEIFQDTMNNAVKKQIQADVDIQDMNRQARDYQEPSVKEEEDNCDCPACQLRRKLFGASAMPKSVSINKEDMKNFFTDVLGLNLEKEATTGPKDESKENPFRN